MRLVKWRQRGEFLERIDKAAFRRADLMELMGALLPVDAPGDARALIGQIANEAWTSLRQNFARSVDRLH